MFTLEERNEVRKLVEASISLRLQRRGAREDISLLTVNEKLDRGIFYLLGGVAERNAQARDNLKGAPREEFLSRARTQLADAGFPLVDLPFENPHPVDNIPTIPGRVVGPHGPWEDVLSGLARCLWQYGNDAVTSTIGEPLLVDAQDQLFIIQDLVLKTAAQFARVGFNDSERAEIEANPRVFVLRPLKKITEDVARHYFNMNLVVSGILAAGPIDDSLRIRLAALLKDGNDSWWRAHKVAWDAQAIPETGI